MGVFNNQATIAYRVKAKKVLKRYESGELTYEETMEELKELKEVWKMLRQEEKKNG